MNKTMRKTILSLLTALFGCTAGIVAQTDDNALRINFQGVGNPIETEHLMEGVHITFSDNGEQMHLTVNGSTANYNLDNVSGTTHFSGTPRVQLHANEDPDHDGNYYTTFYSGLEAYTLPDGVKAYTALVEKDDAEETVVRLTAIGGEVLPQGTAVLLHTTQGADFDLTLADGSGLNAPGDNVFSGVDASAAQDAANRYYMLSYGQKLLGFYLMKQDMLLSANKAFLAMSAAAQARALRMVFADGEVDGVENVGANENVNIYNLNGMRLSRTQKGINIVNGNKVIIR